MISIIAVAVLAMIAANVMGRGGRGRFGGWGSGDRGNFRGMDGEAESEMVGRLARMEEAIQMMAGEIERLRAARERDERYLSAGADTPRVPPSSANDPTTA
ncbi:MAG: hypothetical protein ABIT38_07885 [Gemmatimonadaceae bacterium]